MPGTVIKQIVKTPSMFKVDDKFDDERFMRVRIAVMHSGINLNKSSFETKVIKSAKDSFANIPILANVIAYKDEDGNTVWDYGGHDGDIVEDPFHEGEYRQYYEEKVVGIVPETNNFEIVHDINSGNDYAYVDGLLYREYGNYAADILEARGGQTDVSAEIYVDEMSFDADKSVIVVEKMRMAGITLQGADVNPAMKGAKATVFSTDESSRQAQLIEIMRDLKQSLDNYAAIEAEKNSKEGGSMKLDKFNELLEKYAKTVDDIDFEYEDMSDEELEAKFEELFGKTDESASEEEVELEEEDEEIDADADEDDEFDDEEDEEEYSEENEDEEAEYSVKYSVEYNGNVVTMSVSLQDKINALYELVNNTYGDDGVWYEVTVYDDDRYVIMVDYWNGKAYKQSYKVKKDVYTLIGDRVEVFARYLTSDEIAALEKLKADYSAASEKLAKYEDEPKKMNILMSSDYEAIADNEEFISLCEQDNHFDMSVAEVSAKADEILVNAVKNKTLSYSTSEDQSIGRKVLPPSNKKKKKFGSIFDGII